MIPQQAVSEVADIINIHIPYVDAIEILKELSEVDGGQSYRDTIAALIDELRKINTPRGGK